MLQFLRTITWSWGLVPSFHTFALFLAPNLDSGYCLWELKCNSEMGYPRGGRGTKRRLHLFVLIRPGFYNLIVRLWVYNVRSRNEREYWVSKWISDWHLMRNVKQVLEILVGLCVHWYHGKYRATGDCFCLCCWKATSLPFSSIEFWIYNGF